VFWRRRDYMLDILYRKPRQWLPKRQKKGKRGKEGWKEREQVVCCNARVQCYGLRLFISFTFLIKRDKE